MKGSHPGVLVDIGGTRLHCQVEGAGKPPGTPVVVLEAGIAASSVSWCLVRPLVAKFATVVSYDRAGFGWSDPPQHACTAADAAADLAGLLDRCGVSGCGGLGGGGGGVGGWGWGWVGGGWWGGGRCGVARSLRGGWAVRAGG